MSQALALSATPRTELGKGPSRRARRAGLIPVVIYGKGFEPAHVTVNRLEFTAIVRHHGLNAVINVDIEGTKQLAMIKSVDQNVLTLEIDHADLLAIHRGEKVEVEVPVVYTGEPAPGTMIIQDADTIRVEADVLSIPEEISVSVEGVEVGTQITAGDITLPEEVTLTDDPELLILNVVYPETADEPVESEEASEGGEQEASES
ncbi:50S ribosomal protein L25/general stress protein Ctc [Corynebacterium canis]|uniref:Large ribosomal subunit protein bL25 n=1 Tax=Corynebacterium canis TaxID=679663 RepID=A0A5C5UE98_9CORY|nr:50S ribosomal protein L25/general stress protein Ctc [Corynebacterium canis]TWT23983.1 50S ribosomal protein L25/general stress protein Ctc [Corynebacterium canis]WJY74751.1 50S ribosomal protein L25 [Corynebacterium canis]